jgi:hypothetical protein
VAVRGYGVVVWRDPDDWKAFGRSDRLTATLSTRVQMALDASGAQSVDQARDALLTIAGAAILTDIGDLPEDEPETDYGAEAGGLTFPDDAERPTERSEDRSDAGNGFTLET